MAVVLCALAWCRALQAGPVGTVLVEAERSEADAPARDDPSGVAIIDARRLEGKSAGRSVSLAEILDGEAGLRVRSSGGLGQFSGALLRGSGSTQVAIFLDGVPLNRGGQGTIDLSQLAVDGIERIEIYRGVPPPELGVDAVGGAINLVSRRGREAGSSLRGVLGGGSFGLRKASTGYESGSRAMRLGATIGYAGAQGDFPYHFTEGYVYGQEGLAELRRRNDGFDQVAADVRVGYERPAYTLRVQGHGFYKRQGVAGIGQPDASPGAPDLTLGRALLSAGAKGRLLGGRLEISADVHGLLERTQLRDLIAAPAQLREALGSQIGGQAGLRLLPSMDQLFTALVEARYERLRTSDLCPAPRLDCGDAAPTESERLRGMLSLHHDLRVDRDRLMLQPGFTLLLARSRLLSPPDVRVDPGQEEHRSSAHFFSPRIGARLRLLRSLIARVSAGRFVRLPTFLEIFGDRAFFRPSLALQPESAWLLEAGTRAQADLLGLSLTAEVSAFFRVVDDLIDTIRDGPQLRARNVGGARMFGGETEISIDFRRIVSARLLYSLLDARDLTDLPGRKGRLLPGRPQHSVFLRLDLGLGPLKLYYELDHTSSLYIDPGNLLPRPPRTLHALGLVLGPFPGLQVSLQIELRNLLDTRLVALPLPLRSDGRAASFPLVDFFDYPLPGRAVYATLSARR